MSNRKCKICIDLKVYILNIQYIMILEYNGTLLNIKYYLLSVISKKKFNWNLIVLHIFVFIEFIGGKLFTWKTDLLYNSIRFYNIFHDVKCFSSYYSSGKYTCTLWYTRLLPYMYITMTVSKSTLCFRIPKRRFIFTEVIVLSTWYLFLLLLKLMALETIVKSQYIVHVYISPCM